MATFEDRISGRFDNALTGNAGENLPVTIYEADTSRQTKPSLTDIKTGAPLGNPITTGLGGYYGFEADAGVYEIVLNEGQAGERVLFEALSLIEVEDRMQALETEAFGLNAVTTSLLSLDPNTQRIVSSLPFQTTLNSLYLEDHMRISSAGTGVALTNLDTGAYSYPVASVLKDHSVPINRTAAGAIRASADDFGEKVDDGSINTVRINQAF